VNFWRIFILNLLEIIKHITCMLINFNNIKWNPEDRKSFEYIKIRLTKADQSSHIVQPRIHEGLHLVFIRLREYHCWCIFIERRLEL
jgi:hypothetical protein